MRKLLVLAGIAVVAVFAAAVTYLTLLDVNQFRPQIQAAIQKQLGRPVSLGTMALRIVPLSIRIANVRIGEDPAFRTGRPFASTGQVSAAVSLFPLLRKQIHVESFVLRDPVIEMVRDRNGKWNFASLGGGGRSGEGAGGGLSISELRVENGTVAVSELGKRRSVYEHINISLTEFEPGRPFRLKLAAALPGGSGESLRLEAAGGPFGTPQAPFTGRIEVRQAAFAALRQFLSAGATQADGIIDGAIDFELKNSAVTARPRLAIDKIRVGGRDLGRGVRIEGALQHDLDSGLLRASGLRLSAGDVPVLISGQVDTRGSSVDLTARTNGAPVAELLSAAAMLTGAGISGSGRLTLDARVRGPLDRVSELEYFGQGALRDAALNLPSLKEPLQVPSADLKLTGKAASLDGLVCSLGGSTLRGSVTVRDFAAPAAGFDLAIDQVDGARMQSIAAPGSAPAKCGAAPASPFTAKGKLSIGTLSYNELVLKQVRSECSFAGGVLTLAPLTAQVFNGTQTGGITVDLRSEPAAIAVNTKLESVDANQLLSATTSLKRALYGLLMASGNASMKLLPGTDGTRTLNGALGIRLEKGRLGGINLMNEIASLGKFAGFANSAQPFTDLVSLTGDVQVRDGVARSDNLLLGVEGGSVGAAGTVNLVDESLNLRLTAILGREVSQRVGGSRIGGYLTTALVNNQGELVIPALVTGTFAKPRFAPDVARVAEMKLKNVLPSSGVAGVLTGEKGAARSLLESITGKPREEAGREPPAAPAGGERKRKGLLGALETLQKKTQQPAPAQPGPPQ